MVRNRKAKGRQSPSKLFGRGRAAGLLLLTSIASPAIPASVPVIPAPAVVRATPALWEVSDGDTKIYLFGTFHSLDGRTVWFDDRVRQVFDGSDELVLETIVPSAQAKEGKNTFEVRAKLLPPASNEFDARKNISPGMEGIANLDTERHSLMWIASRRVVDAVRLWLW